MTNLTDTAQGKGKLIARFVLVSLLVAMFGFIAVNVFMHPEFGWIVAVMVMVMVIVVYGPRLLLWLVKKAE